MALSLKYTHSPSFLLHQKPHYSIGEWVNLICMLHSYLIEGQYRLPDGTITVVEQCLKTRKGDPSTEKKHLEMLEFMASKVDYRNKRFMKHSPRERKKLKYRKKHLEIPFMNEVIKPELGYKHR